MLRSVSQSDLSRSVEVRCGMSLEPPAYSTPGSHFGVCVDMRLIPTFRALFAKTRGCLFALARTKRRAREPCALRAVETPPSRMGVSGRGCRREMLRSARSREAPIAYSRPQSGNSFAFCAEMCRGAPEFRFLDKLVSPKKSIFVCP